LTWVAVAPGDPGVIVQAIFPKLTLLLGKPLVALIDHAVSTQRHLVEQVVRNAIGRVSIACQGLLAPLPSAVGVEDDESRPNDPDCSATPLNYSRVLVLRVRG
jgi:hypothetical protein